MKSRTESIRFEMVIPAVESAIITRTMAVRNLLMDENLKRTLFLMSVTSAGNGNVQGSATIPLNDLKFMYCVLQIGR